jgi:hypothetical protein
MKVLKLTISCLLIFILSYGVSHAQQTTLFAAAAEDCGNTKSEVSTLYTVDPLNGNSIEVGPIEFEGVGFRSVTGLAFLGDGRLVGSASADDNGDKIAILIEINRFTGQASEIGVIGDDQTSGECGRAPDLTYDSDTDTLFTVAKRCTDDSDQDEGFLMRINQTTGQGTILGDTGESGSGGGLAIRNDSTLFWAYRPGAANMTALFTINPVTGQATQINDFGTNVLLNALAFHPVTGVLFASVGNLLAPFGTNEILLQTVNSDTNSITPIGQMPDCTDAIVFSPIVPTNVPTLSEWGLIAMAGILGIVGFMVMRRRKVTA